MGMRSSDVTFLRREVMPILTRAAAISPDAEAALEALTERLSEPPLSTATWPHNTVIVRFTHSGEYETIILHVDDVPVPYIVGCAQPDGMVSLILDNRYGFDAHAEEVERWAPFLANAMAISAGRTSHGPNSFIRNPHGRSGGGDPPELVGSPLPPE